MNRKVLWLAALTVAAHWQAVYAQTLVLPEQTPLGKKIVSTIEDLPAGAKVAYKADATGDVAKRNGTEAYWWGVPGWHDAAAVVFLEGDEEPKWLTAQYLVGDAPPPGPVPPAPIKSLADLAGKDAAVLAKVYASLLKDVPNFTSVAAFRQFEKIVLTELGLDANGAAAEIDKRLSVQSLAELKAALEKIIADLGAGPTPPTPPPPGPAGKRHVVIVRESEDDTPDMAFLFNALRTDEPSKWLKEHGHTLAIHDDDDQDQNGAPIPLVEKLEQLGPVPGLFVLDQASGIVVHKQELPRTAPEVIDVVKAH